MPMPPYLGFIKGYYSPIQIIRYWVSLPTHYQSFQDPTRCILIVLEHMSEKGERRNHLSGHIGRVFVTNSRQDRER